MAQTAVVLFVTTAEIAELNVSMWLKISEHYIQEHIQSVQQQVALVPRQQQSQQSQSSDTETLRNLPVTGSCSHSS